ncbi:MAG: PAS domain S-box protein [Holophaga sp.]|nr:PAS domain S-box protein [Holophaga sp.]
MQPREASFEFSLSKEWFETTSDLVLVADPQGVITRTNGRAAGLFADGASLGMPFWTRLGLDCGSLEEAVALCSAPAAPKARFTSEAAQVPYDIQVVPVGAQTGETGFLVLLKEVPAPSMSRAELERQVKERALALARSQKMLHTVFQGVGKGIILVDEDGEVLESNQKACETFGIHPENIQGAHIRSLCAGADQDTILHMMDVIVENQVLSSEVTALYVDKRSFPAVFTVSVITVEGSRLWIIITEDISRQKGLENQLKTEKVLTEEANIALRNVLKSIQREQEDLADKLSHHITQDLFPILHKIRSADSEEERNGYIDLMGELLTALTRGSDPQMDFARHRLSKAEMKICNFIQAGFSSKEIGATMNLAFDTIQTHRKNIRKKLGLAGSAKTSLHDYLNNPRGPSLA